MDRLWLATKAYRKAMYRATTPAKLDALRAAYQRRKADIEISGVLARLGIRRAA